MQYSALKHFAKTKCNLPLPSGCVEYGAAAKSPYSIPLSSPFSAPAQITAHTHTHTLGLEVHFQTAEPHRFSEEYCKKILRSHSIKPEPSGNKLKRIMSDFLLEMAGFHHECV